MRRTFHSEQWLPYPLELVFAFFANPQNLPRLMPPWQKARIEEAAIVAPPQPPETSPASRLKSIAAGAGSLITITFKPFPHAPIRIPWQAEITAFTWNHRFCDTQLRGPFASWNHCHTVTSETQPNETGKPIQGTRLADDIDYELPLGKLGDLANHLFIARQLHNTFAYRHTRTRELLAQILQPSQ
jgi:ligand-binding SRPBCC domain-containing protein